MLPGPLSTVLEPAVRAREPLLDAGHEAALRLFNGFSEGEPKLAVDLYARTLVLHNYADPPEDGEVIARAAQEFLQTRLPWIRATVLKTRHSPSLNDRRGEVVFGTAADRRVRENGVWYALDLCLSQDAGLYLDTRHLRRWAKVSLEGKTVLNTFAYTGSLGVAALAGGAARAVQLDRNRNFLNQARTSYTLNGFPIHKRDFAVSDFWPQTNQMKRAGERFDCVFLDPPFFAATNKGVVDQARNSARLINKVRPLINDGGYLIAINSALFVSGRDYLETLTGLCSDGYLSLETLIPVPDDVTGYPQTRVAQPFVDPAPFNHATKIAVLRVRRKAERESA